MAKPPKSRELFGDQLKFAAPNFVFMSLARLFWSVKKPISLFPRFILVPLVALGLLNPPVKLK